MQHKGWDLALYNALGVTDFGGRKSAEYPDRQVKG